MGKFSFNIPDDFIKQLGKLSDIDSIAPQMIDEAMPILAENLKSELAKHKRTGDMINSVKKTKARKTKYGGYYAVVRPTGKDRKGVRNIEKLAYLEYGVKIKGEERQSPKPVLTKAIKDSEKAVLSKMQEVFEREIK